MSTYVPPVVNDYGSLAELTAATAFAGAEDGGMKLELIIPHHSL